MEAETEAVMVAVSSPIFFKVTSTFEKILFKTVCISHCLIYKLVWVMQEWITACSALLIAWIIIKLVIIPQATDVTDVVHFTGQGKNHKDAASIRTTCPIPASCGIYYFEVKVISKGRDG